MKWFIGFLCILTVFTLFDELSLSEEVVTEKSHLYKLPNNIDPVKEQKILPVEEEWLAYLQETEVKTPEPEQKSTQAKKPPYPTLTVGDKNYQLLGILKKDNQPFILLKAPDSKLIELKEGATLSEGVVLQTIAASAIILSQGGELIKFKLFERSDHGE
ncbi:general secretion pathway protein GspB [Pseudoalteromonas sp. KG3]|uniref:hypothetical protein n=1 Tax=Pseudoalteromonas sp. KG3 TaxID=2951137 RepID=UPI002658D296|nr:hypothetical protein [Pseudoalteromonas sp. KG3]WKD22049.1 general secretion pathway protein GspB [Pseudoalteromonas sp. KG3]